MAREIAEWGAAAALAVTIPAAYSLGGIRLHGHAWRTARSAQLSSRHLLLTWLCALLYVAAIMSSAFSLVAAASLQQAATLRQAAVASLIAATVMCASALSTFDDIDNDEEFRAHETHSLMHEPSEYAHASAGLRSMEKHTHFADPLAEAPRLRKAALHGQHRRSSSESLPYLAPADAKAKDGANAADTATAPRPSITRGRSDSDLHSREHECASSAPLHALSTRQVGTAIRRVGSVTADTAATVIVVMCCLLALMGASNAVAFALELARDLPAGVVNSCIACFCIALSVPMTHGVGGRLKHSPTTSGWRFVQPFSGGWRFIIVQTISWALFGLSMAGFCSQFCLLAVMAFAPRARAFAEAVPKIATSSGIAGLLSEVLVAISLSCFEPPSQLSRQRRLSEGVKAQKQPLCRFDRIQEALNTWLVIAVMYTTPQLTVITVSLIAGLLPPQHCAVFFATAAAAYALTYRGRPEATGRRAWPAFQAWLAWWAQSALTKWCGGISVINDCGTKLDPEQKHVFGFHPHGMYPVSASWLKLTSGWREAFPSITPITLGASAMFRAPLVREPVLWAGVREVSRGSFRRALRTNRSVLLCPGGQQELVEHTGSTTPVVLCTRHSGFVRMAIEEGARLIPILSFSEAVSFSNVFNMKQTQRATYKRIGFPLPHIPGGHLGFTPIPKRIPQVFVVGRPIDVPEQPKVSGDTLPEVPREQVEAVKMEYYREVERLFEEHKASLGYADAKLKFFES